MNAQIRSALTLETIYNLMYFCIHSYQAIPGESSKVPNHPIMRKFGAKL
jgi:hypothetical protein